MCAQVLVTWPSIQPQTRRPPAGRPVDKRQEREGGASRESVPGVPGVPNLTRVLSWILVLAFFLLGVVTATGSPGDPGKGGSIGVVLGVAVGVFVILLSLWTGAVVAGARQRALAYAGRLPE